MHSAAAALFREWLAQHKAQVAKEDEVRTPDPAGSQGVRRGMQPLTSLINKAHHWGRGCHGPVDASKESRPQWHALLPVQKIGLWADVGQACPGSWAACMMHFCCSLIIVKRAYINSL